MSRKDTILIAVVVNAGILAALFTTAVIFDTNPGIEQTELIASAVNGKPALNEPSQNLIAMANGTGDEVDNVLKYYSPSSQPIVVDTPLEYVPEPIAVQSNAADDEELARDPNLPEQHFVEIKVKKGDVLEKLAKSNKTTIEAIKKANHLQNERLSIGQILKIPTKQPTLLGGETKKESKPEIAQEQKKENSSTEPIYYIVKSGDNPWKIARKFHLEFEDLLALNQLDEEKAKNLKIGQKIRIR